LAGVAAAPGATVGLSVLARAATGTGLAVALAARLAAGARFFAATGAAGGVAVAAGLRAGDLAGVGAVGAVVGDSIVAMGVFLARKVK